MLPSTLTEAARALGIRPETLRSYLDGRNTAPAEIKLALAELVGVLVEQAWTPEALTTLYIGPQRPRLTA